MMVNLIVDVPKECIGTHFQKGLSKEGRLALNVDRTVPMGWEPNVIKGK